MTKLKTKADIAVVLREVSPGAGRDAGMVGMICGTGTGYETGVKVRSMYGGSGESTKKEDVMSAKRGQSKLERLR